MPLTAVGISRVIRELTAYRDKLETKCTRLRERIAEELSSNIDFRNCIISVWQYDRVGEVKSKIYSFIQPDVTVTVQDDGNTTLVIANGEDAVWVEFGTGVFYNGSAGSSPHERGEELGFLIGSYGQGKGKRQTWGYKEGGELYLTHGIPAYMPMFKAMQLVIQQIDEIGREVFAYD